MRAGDCIGNRCHIQGRWTLLLPSCRKSSHRSIDTARTNRISLVHLFCIPLLIPTGPNRGSQPETLARIHPSSRIRHSALVVEDIDIEPGAPEIRLPLGRSGHDKATTFTMLATREMIAAPCPGASISATNHRTDDCIEMLEGDPARSRPPAFRRPSETILDKRRRSAPPACSRRGCHLYI